MTLFDRRTGATCSVEHQYRHMSPRDDPSHDSALSVVPVFSAPFGRTKHSV
ncbi:MAG: hypothetical protein HY770_04815 [Chitinivibrionia bacterium]|nr:hypothetical protein [Chitinivibrionia bacterium]